MRREWQSRLAWVGVALFFGVAVGAPLAYLAFRKASDESPRANVALTASRLADLDGKVGQRVRLTGSVKMASYSMGDNSQPVVMLDWSTGTEVQCAFRAGGGWFSTLERGQKLTVEGRVTYYMPGMAFLDDCEPVK